MKEKAAKSNRMNWLYTSTFMTILFIGGYLVGDSVLSSRAMSGFRIVFLIIGLVTVIIAGVATARASRYTKLLPILYIILSIILLVWIYFALNFQFTY